MRALPETTAEQTTAIGAALSVLDTLKRDTQMSAEHREAMLALVSRRHGLRDAVNRVTANQPEASESTAIVPGSKGFLNALSALLRRSKKD